MAKVEYIYYKDKNGFVSNTPTVDKYNPYRTEEVIRDEIVNKYGCEIITEKEFHEIRFNNAMARMKRFLKTMILERFSVGFPVT